MVRFEKAHMLAKGAKEALYERRSVRGLAAAARLQVGASFSLLATHLSHRILRNVARYSHALPLRNVTSAHCLGEDGTVVVAQDLPTENAFSMQQRT